MNELVMSPLAVMRKSLILTLVLLLLLQPVLTYQAHLQGVRLEPHLTQVKPQPRPGKMAPWMRPTPSEDLPIEPLEEGLDMFPKPSDKDKDEHELHKLLGKDFDSKFMATIRPLESILKPNGTIEFQLKTRKLQSNLPRELRKASLRHLPSRRRRKYRIRSKRTRKRMIDYLGAYTYCPVVYKWKELGERFWPRWIREGSCYQGRSCSVPAGMTCRPQDATRKTILWWHCRQEDKCSWIPIRYPIITKCSCSC